MYWFLHRLSSNWSLVVWLLRGGLLVTIGLVAWVARVGGKKRLLEWIVEIDSTEQEDAIQRMTSSLGVFQSQCDRKAACFDFIGGMDQWRAAQTRIAQRRSSVHRSEFPICIFSLFAVAALIAGHFEEPPSTWSGLFVAGAIIGAGWLLATMIPICYMMWLKGVPHPAKSTSNETATNNPVQTPSTKNTPAQN